MCGLMVFLSTTTLWTCWLGIMEEKAALAMLPDAQMDEGPTQRAGSASESPGRATSFIDHNYFSGPWLPLSL